jgi:hypothetical protein
MGFTRTHLAIATAAVTNQFVTSVDMKIGSPYTLANAGAMPTDGARHVTCTRTVVATADTPGTLTIVGKDLTGNTITESLTVGAHSVLVTGTKWFASVTSVTGVGWVIDQVEGTKDTIVVGCTAAAIAVEGSGTLHSISVNTTANGAVTIADAGGTIAILKASIAEGNYIYDVAFSGYLSITAAAASDLTIIHTGSLPSIYAS